MDTGWISPTTCDRKFSDWDNPEKAYSSNDDYCTDAIPDLPKYQSFEAFDFGIPSGATIDGIEVSVEWKYAGDAPDVNWTSWYSASDPGYSDNKNVPLDTTEATEVVGGATDLWGRTPIDTDFSDANFSVYVAVGTGEFQTCNISLDHIQVKVYYTEAAPENYTESSTEALALSDVVSGVAKFKKSEAEALALSDAVTKTAKFKKSKSEALEVSDDAQKQVNFHVRI